MCARHNAASHVCCGHGLDQRESAVAVAAAAAAGSPCASSEGRSAECDRQSAPLGWESSRHLASKDLGHRQVPAAAWVRTQLSGPTGLLQARPHPVGSYLPGEAHPRTHELALKQVNSVAHKVPTGFAHEIDRHSTTRKTARLQGVLETAQC
jgi:hypothetical protein